MILCHVSCAVGSGQIKKRRHARAFRWLLFVLSDTAQNNFHAGLWLGWLSGPSMQGPGTALVASAGGSDSSIDLDDLLITGTDSNSSDEGRACGTEVAQCFLQLQQAHHDMGFIGIMNLSEKWVVFTTAHTRTSRCARAQVLCPVR